MRQRLRGPGIALLAAGLAALVLSVPACGRYGKPVRPEPVPEPAEHARSLEKR